MIWMLNALLTGYGNDELVTQLIDNLDFYILPVMNADGYAYTFV